MSLVSKKGSARKTFCQAEISFESEGCPSTTCMYRKDAQRRKKLKIGIFHNHSENCDAKMVALWSSGSEKVLGKELLVDQLL